MKEAIDAVKSGKNGANRAAKDHGVPATALKNWLSGRVQKDTNSVPSGYLNDKEIYERL